MNTNLQSWKLPVLAASSGPAFKIHGIRELTEDETQKLSRYTEIAADARNRFKLFAILKRNYSEWWKYTRSLLSPGGELQDEELLELDRLLLNFLSSTKSVLDHFRQHWVQAYRRTDKELEFDVFIGKLEQECWAFAFFQDLRNFTQHCGLPVGAYSRTSSTSSVTLLIQADSEWLVDHYKGWKKSKLTKDRGLLDLLILCRDYYVRLQQDFGNFVATAFAPNVLEAHEFLAGLADEVRQHDPKATLRVITKLKVNDDGLSCDFTSPPADLLGSLGIVMLTAPKQNKPLDHNRQPAAGSTTERD